MTILSFLLSLNLSTSWAGICYCDWSGTTLTISNCSNGAISSCSDGSNQKTANDVIIGTGVTSIGSYAFSGASSLTSITIPEGVTSIRSGAFSGASSLTSITIPDSVTSIGDYAFQNATGLTNITIPEGVTSIGRQAFDNASSLTSITIPNSVTSIGESAFSGASSLESIIIPDSVTSIGVGAFSGTSSLTSITLPEEGVTSIENYAFYNARSLTSITLPDSVTSIGDYAFQNATGLTNITIPDSVTSIGVGAFMNAYILTNIICKGDEESCADTVNALRAKGYTGNISYPTDKTSCEGTAISLYVWDDGSKKCGRRNETQCNSVAKYYYNSSANNGAGQCQLLPKTQTACSGNGLAWNTTNSKCTNTNYTPPQEANNGNTSGDDTGGDDVGDISGDFNPADCYNNGQVPYNNQCYDEYPFAKKRWTPAEANEWLHDGNDNFVVITFKK